MVMDSTALPSLTNIGHRPTFGPQEKNIESYIIDFDKDLYGRKIRIQFIKKLREEIKFESPADLSHQIKKDISAAKNYFNIR